MRLFNGTSLGVHLDSNEHIVCGDVKVEFLPSLYTTRGATFGNSLMFAQLVKGLDGIHRLQGCPVGAHQIAGMDALVLVRLPASSGEITYPADSFGAKIALPQHVKRWKSRSNFGHEFCALISLRAGNSVVITDTQMVSNLGSSTRRPRAAAALVARVTKTRIAFDGKAVTIEPED